MILDDEYERAVGPICLEKNKNVSFSISYVFVHFHTICQYLVLLVKFPKKDPFSNIPPHHHVPWGSNHPVPLIFSFLFPFAREIMV